MTQINKDSPIQYGIIQYSVTQRDITPINQDDVHALK